METRRKRAIDWACVSQWRLPQGGNVNTNEENMQGTQEGEESFARSIHVTKEGESVLERGQWDGTWGTSLWWVYTVLRVKMWLEMELKSQENQLEPGQTPTCMPTSLKCYLCFVFCVNATLSIVFVLSLSFCSFLWSYQLFVSRDLCFLYSSSPFPLCLTSFSYSIWFQRLILKNNLKAILFLRFGETHRLGIPFTNDQR